ncbi:carbohydrate ABC transporter permease [Ilumatobacter sp.]|uniref:carbohydrate ABC transporter permease n=1 Tax=Ilumatobacter sp. TaxID=1967498 RepID=UPI003B52DA9E
MTTTEDTESESADASKHVLTESLDEATGGTGRVGTPLDARPFLIVTGVAGLLAVAVARFHDGGSAGRAITAALVVVALAAATVVAVDRRQNGIRESRFVMTVVGFVLLEILVIGWSATQPKVRSTLVTVLIAVAGSASLWIGANILFNQVRHRWALFSGIAFGTVGFLLGVVLHGNRVTLGSGEGFLTWVIGPIVGAAAFTALGLLLARTDAPSTRLAVGVGAGAAIGIAIGLLVRERYHPGLDLLPTVIWTAAGIAVGAGLSVLMKNSPLGGALLGGALGWILGAWGGADLGAGSILTSVIATTVPAVAIGARLGLTPNPDYKQRAQIDLKSRGVIFLGPALLFTFVMLVVPALRTLYLSFLDADSESFVDGENYGAIFNDTASFDISNWTNMFTSIPFVFGAILLGLAVVVGVIMKQRTGRAVELGNPTSGPLIVGALLLSFGVFTALRGTIINNLWWVVVVTFSSTAMGLAVAVLADGRIGEKYAKSLIFMPMAISLVGASIIWRFVYAPRDVSQDQTGVLNAIWVALGKLSTGSGLPTLIGTILLGLVLLALLATVGVALTKRNWGRAITFGIVAFLVGWLFVRYAGIIGQGIGGFIVQEDGTVVGDTILFVQEPPYNNFWLMVILIWIQTGFAMVILSAAIKAVPTELIEAAKMDGATSSQVFWRVTLPQISTTIGVVVTTIIVLVMKVYDIVKVITNGQFGTQVLANDMFNTAFQFRDTGKGAALAILILISVLPVMVYNISQMQKED